MLNVETQLTATERLRWGAAASNGCHGLAVCASYMYVHSVLRPWMNKTNPPTRFGVHSLLFLCSIQNFVTRCPSKIPSPKSKIQDPKSKIPKIQNPKSPKSKIPKFQNPNFAHKDLLHNVPKIQNPQNPENPKSKIQNPQIPKIQNPQNPKSQNPKSPQSKIPKIPKSKIQTPKSPKSQKPKSPKSKIQAFLAGF